MQSPIPRGNTIIMVVAMKEVNNRWLKILFIFSKVEVFLIFHNVTNFPTFFSMACSENKENLNSHF